MKQLLDGELAPLTFSWGFLEAPLEVVSDAYASWQKKILHSVKIRSIHMRLDEALRQLEPLDIGSQRVLFLSTRSSWTACFDNGVKGGQPSTFAGELAQQVHCRGVACADVPRYASKRVADRFTPEMLEAYCGALGIELFDVDFYVGPGHVTSSRQWFLPRLPGVSLTDARKQLGLE